MAETLTVVEQTSMKACNSLDSASILTLAVKDYVAGLSLAGTSVKYKISRRFVRKAIVDAGLPVRKLSQSWKNANTPSQLIANINWESVAQRYSQGESLDKIAKDLKVSPTSLSKYFDQRGIEKRNSTQAQREINYQARQAEIDWKQIVELYNEGCFVSDLAVRTSLPSYVVIRNLVARGVVIRKAGEVAAVSDEVRLRRCDETVNKENEKVRNVLQAQGDLTLVQLDDLCEDLAARQRLYLRGIDHPAGGQLIGVAAREPSTMTETVLGWATSTKRPSKRERTLAEKDHLK